MTRLLRPLVAVALLMGTAGGVRRVEAATASPVRLNFSKSLTTQTPTWIWDGSVTGDVTAQLQTRLVSLRVSGAIWHVEFDWIVSSSNPAQSFTARLNGAVNTKTGKVVMNGVVVEGYLEGAQVHEEGQLTDPATWRFEGNIRVMPGSAD
jgi:hypothetical protein